MTTEHTTSVRPPSFYTSEIYFEEFDFTVADAEEAPLPELATFVEAAAKRARHFVAAALVAGVITIPAAVVSGSAYAGPDVTAEGVSVEPPAHISLRLMTERMRERAGLAARVFQRTPHPGADEPDPDYGL